MIIQIDSDKVTSLVKDGDKILFSKDGEDTILELHRMEQMIADALSSVKEKIKDAALKLDPTFTSIQGDKVKVSYRAYGTRYRIDSSRVNLLPQDCYKTKVTYMPQADFIEEFADKNGGLPIGVLENQREKQIQITVKEDK